MSTQHERRAPSGRGHRRGSRQLQAPSTRMANNPEQATPEGSDFLQLPEHVLERIAWYLKAREWARGPAQACRSLHCMHLSRLLLDIPKYDVLSEHGRRYQLYHGMKWVARRLGPCTLSLEIRAPQVMSTLDVIQTSGLQAALSKACNLRCFSFEPLGACSFDPDRASPSDSQWASFAAFNNFQGRLLEQAPRIEAFHVLHHGPRPGAAALRLQHLKHVEMDAEGFGIARSAGQVLPNLETLYLHGRDDTYRNVGVLGCENLRQLVLEGKYTIPPLHEPHCQVGSHAHGFALSFHKADAFGAEPEAVREDERSPLPPFLAEIGRFTDVETLAVTWPLEWDARTSLQPIKDLTFAKLDSLLLRCMPLRAPALRNLKALLLTVEAGMHCYIPGGLLQLEEVVLLGRGGVQVSFEDPLTMFSAVKTFYIFGQPLNTNLHGNDMRQVSQVMAKRGLLISTASANNGRGSFAPNKDFQSSAACTYVRPSTGWELSIRELYDIVYRRARQCRCGACFECLRRAGCLTGY